MIIKLFKIFFLSILFIPLFYANADTEPASFISPTESDTLYTGKEFLIKWKINDAGVTRIRFEYDYPCGIPTGSITCTEDLGIINKDDESVSWLVPYNLTSKAKLKMFVDYFDGSNTHHMEEIVSGEFNVVNDAVIRIDKPSGGETFKKDDTVDVVYEYKRPGFTSDNASSVQLYKGSELIEEDVYISGSKKWWINKDYEAGDDYKLRIYSGTAEAYSNNFSIKGAEIPSINIISPIKDQTLKIGNNYVIKWGVDGSYHRVGIWLDVGEGEGGLRRVLPITPFSFDAMSFNSIVTLNNGSFEWKIPSSIDVSSVDFGGKAFSYRIRLDPADNSFHTTATQAPVVTENNKTTYKLEPPYEITPGQYRIFIQLSNTGSVLNPSIFSDYFYISNTDENISGNISTNNQQPSQPSNSNITNQNNGISANIEVKNTSMYNNLKGKIMLKVEDNGEAFYVHPTSEKMYYLGRPNDAFAIMREQGVGITNANLAKIPVGLNNLTGPDSDGDGLPDLFEDAIGTNKNNSDSDGDGHNDKTELSGNYNPNGSGKLNLDNNFSGVQKGKIFLQVERNGEAWYINPADGKRYFLGRPADAFQVMRNLGLGISNNDFAKL